MITILNNRELEIEEFDGIDFSDYPDFCDAYISKAYWIDTGEELSDDEMEELNENGDLVYEAVMNHLY